MKKPKNILIIRLSAMGDVAMMIPVLRVFSKTYPEIQLTIVSRVFFKPFFEDFKNLSFIEADPENKHKGIKGLLKLFKKINSLNIDAVADLHNVIRSKILTKLLKFNGKKCLLSIKVGKKKNL